MPLYTTPMLGVIIWIFCTVVSSTSTEGSFFSVAITTPSVALMPSEVTPAATAFNAYSIWTSLPGVEGRVGGQGRVHEKVNGTHACMARSERNMNVLFTFHASLNEV